MPRPGEEQPIAARRAGEQAGADRRREEAAGRGDEAAAAAHRSDQARVEDRLRDAIVTGRFQPSERLVEVDVARELGVGRSAVRTALARLEHEGLVEHERNRGARVRLVGAREAVEILETRAMLEGLAARHAAHHATASDVEGLNAILDGMRRRLDAGDLLGASDQNAVLHGRILEISGHSTGCAADRDAQVPAGPLPIPHDPATRPQRALVRRAQRDRPGDRRR